MSLSLVEVFTEEQCKELVEAFDSADLVPDDYGFSPNSYGISNLPAANRHSLYMIERLFELRPELSSKKIVFKNTYTRKYLYNSKLRLHIDRPGLDYTFSVCIEKSDNFQWPLQVSNVSWDLGDWDDDLSDYSLWTNNCTSYNIDVGWAAFAEGRKYPHWRDLFPEGASDTERAVYIFYHWEEI